MSDAARDLIRGLAAGMAVPYPARPGRWVVDAQAAWAAARALPPPRDRQAMALVGRLAKMGASRWFATCALAHFVEHHERVRNPFSYYNPSSRTGEMMLADWSRRAEIQQHREEEALNRAWLAGNGAALGGER